MVLFNVAVACEIKLSPTVFTLSAAIHVKLEATLLVKGILTVPPLHIVAVLALVIEGIGLTVIVAVIAAPAQPPAVGVIVYIAMPALVVVAVNVWAIVAPELADAPVTLVCVTVHANVAPPVLLVNAMDVALFEQIL
jgi:hypothetical protein